MPTLQLLPILVALLVHIGGGQYFKTNSHTFSQRINGDWVDFGRFAAVNLGVTKPGYLPGQVILTAQDYERRFNQLEKLGVRVIRVYALLPPSFYQTLMKWNANHDNAIYVLHGTAFPEYEMEANNGTDAFNDTVSLPMIDFINRTVAAVYGQGDVIYKYYHGTDPVIGSYKDNIAQYLLGWVMAGETSPYCVYATNQAHPLSQINPYTGVNISSVNESSAFEIWMAQMMDYLANSSANYGYSAPISWTNWATTDGIKNPVEPRYAANDAINSSIEDWQEIDLHNFDFSHWKAGSFYNQHAYPYYPEFITLLNDETGTNNITDPYIEYISRLREYYNDLPFIITEVGLSTTYGVASFEDTYHRNHGHVSEENQGILLRNIILTVMKDVNITGITIFQLQDEWFKKSWNTMKFEPNEPDGSGRNYWMNALSAEQGFGIFGSEPARDMKTQTYNDNNYFTNVQISNDERFLKLDFETKLNEGKVLIGLNSIPGGSDEISNLPLYTDKKFQQNIDFLFEIDVATKDVKFYVAGCQDYFRKKFGEWLAYLPLDNFTMTYSAEYISECQSDIFQSYLMLVKSPGYKVRNEKYIYTPHRHLEIQFKDTGDNLSLLKISNNNSYAFKIPYEVISFSNPALKQKYRTVGYSNSDKDIQIKYLTDDTPPEFEISQFTDDGIEFGGSIMHLKYDWDEWEVPECYQVRAKNGFNYLRQAFSEINGYVSGDLTEQEIERLSYVSCSDRGFKIFHQLVAVSAYVFLDLCFLTAAFIQNLCYCYGCKKAGKSSRFQKINFIFFVLLNLWAYYLYSIHYWDIRFHPLRVNIKAPGTEIKLKYFFYIFVVILSDLILLIKIIFFGRKWNLYAKSDVKNNYNAPNNAKKHAVIIACHNSSNCIGDTLESLLTKVSPGSIYVADNGSSEAESEKTKDICMKLTIKYYRQNHRAFDKNKYYPPKNEAISDEKDNINYSVMFEENKETEMESIYINDHDSESDDCIGDDEHRVINYGYYTDFVNGRRRGNKTIAQYISVVNLPSDTDYVTCIDDDTRLHSSWDVNKVIVYFESDPTIGVLAYALCADNFEYDIEMFQDLEYKITGFSKIFQSSNCIFNSTIFNSGAFGTYRVKVLREAFQYHNTHFNGDDLQICLNMHQLKGKKYISGPELYAYAKENENEIETHSTNYRVKTATNMMASTIVPKCWVHSGSVSKCCSTKCSCGEPDLYGQRVNGWFVSKHRFIPRYIKCVFNCKGRHGIWVRLVIFWNLLIILNEYFAILYILYIWRHLNIWFLEGLIIGTAFNVFVTILFNMRVLKPNKLNLPFEVITLQTIIYKVFMITLYRYMGLFYNLYDLICEKAKGTKCMRKKSKTSHLKAAFKKFEIEIKKKQQQLKNERWVVIEEKSGDSEAGAEESKEEKYDYTLGEKEFCPFAIEQLGCDNDSAIDLFHEIDANGSMSFAVFNSWLKSEGVIDKLLRCQKSGIEIRKRMEDPKDKLREWIQNMYALNNVGHKPQQWIKSWYNDLDQMSNLSGQASSVIGVKDSEQKAKISASELEEPLLSE